MLRLTTLDEMGLSRREVPFEAWARIFMRSGAILLLLGWPVLFFAGIFGPEWAGDASFLYTDFLVSAGITVAATWGMNLPHQSRRLEGVSASRHAA